MKRCTKCGVWKHLSNFPKNRTKNDGHSYECKSCTCEYNKKYYQKNKIKENERSKKYSKENREKVNAHQKKYRQKNEKHRHRNKEVMKEYYQNNKKKFKKYRDDHREQSNAYMAVYRENNRIKTRKTRRILIEKGGDSYIRAKIKDQGLFIGKEIPQEVIEAKRQLLFKTRLLKEINHEINSERTSGTA